MDLKVIESEILKINQEFINYLDELNQATDQRIAEVIEYLRTGVEDKSTFIKSLEAKIIEEDEVFKSSINEYRTKITEITKRENPLKYNLDEVLVELEKQKEVELNPFLVQEKKIKTELTHKITAQKKELSFLLKANKDKLIEEEKNYKNREFELSRRMRIDLERYNEANIKQYSDIEKSILEMEEQKLINEAQKKINSIRLVGVKEIFGLKNKYALQHYENDLAFKKLKEKIELDNSTITEEFKQRIKTLESEKESLLLGEEQEIMIKDLNNKIKLIEFERENLIEELNLEKIGKDESHSLNKEILSLSEVEYKKLHGLTSEVNNEIYSFDKMQVSSFIQDDSKIVETDQKIIDNLLNSLRNYLSQFKDLIFSSYEDYNSRRNQLLNLLVSFLSSEKFDEIYGMDSSYQDISKNLVVVVESFQKTLAENLIKFNHIMKSLLKGLENQLNLTLLAIKEYRKDASASNKNFYKEVMKVIEAGYREKNNKNYSLLAEKTSKAKARWSLDKEIYKKDLKHLQEKTKNITGEYNIKKRDILLHIENCKKETKLKLNKNKKDLSKYLKQSKAKISNLKKLYNINIANHEKVEKNNYKEILKQNKMEYRNRLESF